MILKTQFAALKAQWAKEEKLKAQIEKKQEQLRKLEGSNKSRWVQTLLVPLALELMVKLGRNRYDIMGPFGLGSETSIWFYDTEEERENCNVDSITFRPDLSDYEEKEPNPFGVTIKSKDSDGSYRSDSLGARNGFNHPNIVPPADADLDWFLQHVSKATEEEPVK